MQKKKENVGNEESIKQRIKDKAQDSQIQITTS